MKSYANFAKSYAASGQRARHLSKGRGLVRTASGRRSTRKIFAFVGAHQAEFILSNADGDVSGNGTLQLSADGQQISLPLSIDGMYDYPEVEMDMTITNPQDASLTGEFSFDGEVTESGEIMNGTLTGGTSSGEIQFVRQN